MGTYDLDERETLFGVLLKVRYLLGVIPEKYLDVPLIDLKKDGAADVAALFEGVEGLTAEEILLLKTEPFLKKYGNRFSLGQIGAVCLEKLAELLNIEAADFRRRV